MVDETFDEMAKASDSKEKQPSDEDEVKQLSKLRYGRQRHARPSPTSKPPFKAVEGFSKSTRRKLKGAVPKESSASSPSDISAAEPLPKLTLIKRPKRKMSSLSESYFIENKAKGAKSDAREDASQNLPLDTKETEDASLKSKKVSPLSLYCDLDGASVINAICKRYKRRPTKSIELETTTLHNTTTSNEEEEQEDTPTIISTIMEDLLNSVEDALTKQIGIINFENPGQDEEMVLKNFCFTRNMNFKDFSDLSVFRINSPIQDVKPSVQISKYTQVPKKRRHSSKGSSTNQSISSSSSRGYNLRNRGSTPTSLVLPKDEDTSDNISSEENTSVTIKTEPHIPEETETFGCFQELVIEEPEIKSENAICDKEEREIRSCVETLLANAEIVENIINTPPEETPFDISREKHSEPSIVDYCSKDNSTTKEEPDDYKQSQSSTSNDSWPLDLSNKNNLSPQNRRKASNSFHHESSRSSPPLSSRNEFLYSKSSPLPVKRSLTVRKLLSMNRERKSTPNEPVKYTSSSPTPPIDQFSSKNISEEDESILKTLLLDSNKPDGSDNPSVLSFTTNQDQEPPSTLSPDSSKSKSHPTPVSATFPNPNNDASILFEKITKLKNEISCLNVMADQKEKERVAILCFKRYKEELLKKILKRHHIACQKDQMVNFSEQTFNCLKKTRTISPGVEFQTKNNDNFALETYKLETTIKKEPKPFEMSPLMAQLSQKKMIEIPKLNTSNANSALKEQLMAKPKMLTKIAPKPIKPYPNFRTEKNLNPVKYSKVPNSRLQAPIWYPLAIPSASKLSSKSTNSSPTQEIMSTELYIQKCSTCRLNNASFLCSRCQKEWYCSTRCQAIQWPSHSVVCNQ